MSLGPATQVVDGQRNTFPTSYAFRPSQYGPQTTGVPNVSPTVPPFLGANATTGGMSPGTPTNVGGYGTADNNAAVTAVANQHPHNLKVSPVWWAVGGLLGGLVLLKAVSWRETTLEGADVSVGPARGRESVEV